MFRASEDQVKHVIKVHQLRAAHASKPAELDMGQEIDAVRQSERCPPPSIPPRDAAPVDASHPRGSAP